MAKQNPFFRSEVSAEFLQKERPYWGATQVKDPSELVLGKKFYGMCHGQWSGTVYEVTGVEGKKVKVLKSRPDSAFEISRKESAHEIYLADFCISQDDCGFWNARNWLSTLNHNTSLLFKIV